MDEYKKATYNEKSGKWEFEITRINKLSGEEEPFIITGDSEYEVINELIKYLEIRSYLL